LPSLHGGERDGQLDGQLDGQRDGQLDGQLDGIAARWSSTKPMKVPQLIATTTHDLPDEGQLIVYDNQGSKLIVLNDMGAAVYYLIDGERDAKQIAQIVEETLEGEVPPDHEEKIFAFLQLLESHQILCFVPGEDQSVAPA
jgi:hypothetical protein